MPHSTPPELAVTSAVAEILTASVSPDQNWFVVFTTTSIYTGLFNGIGLFMFVIVAVPLSAENVVARVPFIGSSSSQTPSASVSFTR